MTTEAVRTVSLHEGVIVYPPADDGDPWVVRRADGSYLRVGAHMGQMLQALTEVSDPHRLATTLGDPWTPEDVVRALEMADGMDLLESGDSAGTRRGRRESARRVARRTRPVTFVPPLTVQFTVVRPERVSQRVRPALRAIPGWLIQAVVVLLPLAGLVSLAAQVPLVRSALTEPVAWWTLGLFALGSFLATSIHELGHGSALTRAGGDPSRLGFMLFYLTPALFCDVSDGWRLPRKQQRVVVALAGVVTQATIGGVCATAAWVVVASGGSHDVATALVLLAVSNYIASVINLIPLVKLDGYIALMSHLDMPHLRDRALEVARETTAWLVLGAPRPAHVRGRPRWLLPLGIGSAVFPIVLVVMALGLWADVLAGFGVPGRVVVLVVAFGAASVVVRGFVKLVRTSRRAGVSGPRLALGVLAALAVTGGVLSAPVPYTVAGGYVCTGERSALVLDEAADIGAVTAGATVDLRSQGVFLSTSVGSATVADGPPATADVPVGALVPVKGFSGLLLPATTIPLATCQTGADGPDAGAAVVDAGSMPVATWLLRTYVTPILG